MIRIILFDVDGVIANGQPFYEHLKRDYGITTTMTASFFQEKFVPCLTGEADLKVEIADYLQQWGWTQSAETFLDYWFTSEHVIDQPLIDYIQQLRQRDIQCYLATQQEKYRATYLLEKMGFASTFDGMYSSATLGQLKSSPKFFTQILQSFDGIAPDEILFWDDTAANVQIARQAGLHAEIYTTFTSFQQKMQTYHRMKQ